MLTATDIAFAYGRRTKRGAAKHGADSHGPANSRTLTYVLMACPSR